MKRTILLAAAVMAVLPFAGCSMESPSHMAPQKMVLVPDEYNTSVPTSVLEGDALRALGDHYRRYGEGIAELVVTYDPSSRTNTAMKASNEAARIAGKMRKNGIKNVVTGIMPVGGQGEESRALVNYRTVSAQAPMGCDTMGGLDGKLTGLDEGYDIGCTSQILFARQLARPADLRGRDELGPGSGRRAANIVETYQSGEPNAPIEGESTN